MAAGSVEMTTGGEADGLSVDLLHWLEATVGRGDSATSAPVVVIAIDEETHRTPPFAGTPAVFWTKELATVLDEVTAAGATVIGFDVIFAATVQRYVPGHDREFLISLRNAALEGKILLGKVQAQMHPIEPFRAQILSVATENDRNVRSVNLFRDRDDVIRRVPLTFARERSDNSEATEPSMSLELAARHLGSRPILLPDGQVELAGRKLPRGDSNALLLRFPWPLTRIKTYSLADMFACALAERRDFFAEHFRGRVILLGTYLDVEDRKLASNRFATVADAAHVGVRCVNPPMGELYEKDLVRSIIPGVFIHATAVSNLIEGTALNALGRKSSFAILFLLALASSLAAFRFNLMVAGCAVLGAASLWLAISIAAFERSVLVPFVPGLLSLALGLAVSLAYRIGIAEREKRSFHRSVSPYLPAAIVGALLEAEEAPRLGGREAEITALYCDIVGSTRLAEERPAGEVIGILNTYFSAMTDLIEREGGFVDKYVGDSIVAIFGGPSAHRDHARRAVRAALDIQTRLRQLNAGPLKDTPLAQCIGIATGKAIVGNIGSRKRLNYTAIGDVMNVASRIERENRTHGTEVLCAGETRAAAGNHFEWREVARVTLRGRSSPVTLFEPKAEYTEGAGQE